VSKWCVERLFPLVPLSDADKVVGIPEVEFGEHRGTVEGGKSIPDEWQGILVLHSDVIQPTEVYARPQLPILFLYKEKNISYPRGRRPDMACSQGILDVPLHGLLLAMREVIQPATGEMSSKLEVHGAVVWPMRWQRHSVVLAEHRS
jgi:hypothetical protein